MPHEPKSPIPVRTLALLLAVLAASAQAIPIEDIHDPLDAGAVRAEPSPGYPPPPAERPPQASEPETGKAVEALCKSAARRVGHPTARPKHSVRKACRTLAEAPVSGAEAGLIHQQLLIQAIEDPLR